MKKKHLTYAKKTLSVFLSVLMLMSAWVFMPGDHNHASAAGTSTATSVKNSATISAIKDVTSDHDCTFTHGSYADEDDGEYTDRYDDSYKNVLYGGTAVPKKNGGDDTKDPAAYNWGIGLKDSNICGVAFYYPEVTFLYTGKDTYRTTAVMRFAVYGSGANVLTRSGYFLNADGMKFDESYWIGSDGRMNFNWLYYDHCSSPSNQFSTTNGIEDDTYKQTIGSGTTACYGAHMVFNGQMGSDEYLREIQPTFAWKGHQKSGDSMHTITTFNYTGKKMRVINYEPLEAALKEALYIRDEVVKKNPDAYTVRSVIELVELVQKLDAAKPYNYVNANKNDYNAYASAAEAAVDAWNSWTKGNTATGGLEKRTVDVTFENIFSLSDWYNSNSSGISDPQIITDTQAGTITINSYANQSGEEKTTLSSHPNTRDTAKYSMSVKPGTDYTVTYTSTGDADSQIFLFWYDADGKYLDLNSSPSVSAGTHKATFTSHENAAQVEIRFDNDCGKDEPAKKVTFSNIAVYPAERENLYGISKWSSRVTSKAYTYGSTLGSNTFFVPTSKMGIFNCWYLDKNGDGVRDSDDTIITDINGNVLSAYTSTVINSHTNYLADMLPVPNDVGYDNMFSLSNWSKTDSSDGDKAASLGGVAYDITNGTISVTATSSTEVYTKYSTGESGYVMAVKPETEYVFEANVSLSNSTVKGQMFIFCYDEYGAAVMGPTDLSNNTVQTTQHVYRYPSTSGKHSIPFKTPENCYQLTFRVGANGGAGTATYSRIGLYEKAAYDAYAKDYTEVRLPFAYQSTVELTFTPQRQGYAFDGWYTKGGTKLTSVAGLTESTIVYAHWIQQHTVTFKNYDGTVLKTEYVTPGADATAPTINPVKNPDDDLEYVFSSWDTDFSNVTSDLVVTAQYTSKKHENIKYTIKTLPDCETPGTIIKICNDCNYAWNNGEAFPDTEGERVGAFGHIYESVIANSANGDVHTVACTRDGCKYGADGGAATITQAHNFKVDADHPASDATCVIPGVTYYKCACLATKEETGSLNPNNHVNTEIRGAGAATCLDDGYTGDTWCTDCNKKIADGEEIPATGHKYTTYVYNNDATCSEDGTETAKCDNCDATVTRTATGTMLTHSYTNYVYDVGTAQCGVNGTKTATCDHGCGTENTIEAEGTALEHDFTGAHKNNNDGTHSFLCKNNCGAYGGTTSCTYGAWTTDNEATHSHSCTVCGYTPAAENHSWSAWTPAEEDGKMKRECTVCGREETTACVYEDVTTAATCEEDAYITYTCEDCGHSYIETLENTKTGHKFDGAYTFDAENDKHQRACTNSGCTAKGVGTEKDAWENCVWTYANKSAGTHKATCTCGNSEEQTCSGGIATCTAKAVCQYCKAAYGETADHVLTGTEEYLKKATDATCIANETYYKYCIGCKEVFSDETYEKPDTKTPHNFTCDDEYLYIATQAKCGVNETYYKYCSNPDCKQSSGDSENTYEKPDTALTHKFDGTVTCNDDGTHTIACTNSNTDGWSCTETETYDCADVAELIGVVPAECLTAGYNMYKCRLCDYEYNVETEPALGHDYSEKNYNNAEYVKEAANCEHGTIIWYGCKYCDANGKDETDTEKYPTLFFENTNDKREHNWVKVADEEYLAAEATCGTAAWYYQSCSHEDCGASALEVEGDGTTKKFQSGMSLGHNWVKPADDELADYLATDADCVNDATYYYVCSRADHCGVESSKGSGKEGGETWTLEDSKKGHNLTHVAATEATCTQAGNYEYWHCATCGKYFKDAECTQAYLGLSETVIKKREHNIVEVSYKAPTCEEDGNPAYRYCSYEDCGYTTLPDDLGAYKATGHNFGGAWTYDEVHLYHSKLCLNGCGKSGLVIDGAQTEYNVSYEGIDFVITGGEQCTFTYKAETKDGVHSHANSCVCGNNTTKTYSDEETFVSTVAPTCTTDGYDNHACPDENCGATWKKNVVKSEGHKIGTTAISNGDGTHSYLCSVEGCGYKASTEKCYGGTATCKDKAICEKCNTAYGETSDHSFIGEWVYQDDAKCDTDGTEKNTCNVCGTVVTRTAKGTALGHDFTEFGYDISGWVNKPTDFDEDIKAPTCKDEGLAIRYCRRCSEYDTKYVAKDSSSHVYLYPVVIDENGKYITTSWQSDGQGDCSTGVTMVNPCTICDAKLTQREQLEHDFEVIEFHKPTCIHNGSKVLECKTCQYIEYLYFDGEGPEDLKATGIHTYELVREVPASCSMNAYTVEKCIVCGDTKITEAENTMLEHTLVDYKGAEATCETDGYSAYKKCSECGTEVNKTIIPAKGHGKIGENGKCEDCGRLIYENEDGNGSCGCICHKESGIMKFLYKILNFFWKLFGISRTCECGNVHWTK